MVPTSSMCTGRALKVRSIMDYSEKGNFQHFRVALLLNSDLTEENHSGL